MSNNMSISLLLRSSIENNPRSIVMTVVLGVVYFFYRYGGVRLLLLFLMKRGMNPIDTDLGQVIPEHDTLSYEQLDGHSAVTKIQAALVGIISAGDEDDDPTNTNTNSRPTITYRQGDLGTAASTHALIKVLQDESNSVRYDYLIVTAAVLTAPKFRNPTPLNEDGIEICFAIGVVGRFLLYRNATTFMNMKQQPPKTTTGTKSSSSHSSPMILNVCAAGDGKGGFDRTLVRTLATPIHFLNDVNYAVGNELMLRKLVSVNEQANNAVDDGSKFGIPITTTHPGFIATELLHDQGWWVDTLVPLLCHFIGMSAREAGRREVSKLCAIAIAAAGTKNQTQKPPKLLAMVDNYGMGRAMNDEMKQNFTDHSDWLWTLLLTIEAGESIENVL